MAKLLHDTSFWSALSFFIFVGLVWWKARGTLRDAVQARITRIRNELAEAEKLRADAQALLSEQKRLLQDATKQAQAIVDAAKHEIKNLQQASAAAQEQNFKRREQQAIDKIAQAEASSLAAVRQVAVDLAIDTAGHVLRDMMQKDGAKQVDAAIAALSAKLH